MRVATAGLLFLNIAFEAAGVCPVSIPSEAWGPSAWKQAISAGKWRGTVAPKGQGFNRTVQVSGLCDDAWTSSSNYMCVQTGGNKGEGGEFKMRALPQKASVPGSVKLSFGGSVCTLSEISFYRTAPAAEPLYPAEMRMEFNSCTPPLVPGRAHSAAVVVGLSKGTREDDEADMGLLSWAHQVCPVQHTTTLQPNTVQTELKAFPLEVGSGECAATVVQNITGAVPTPNACQLRCTGQAETESIVHKPDGCGGFAYEAADQKCILYSGNVTKVDPNSNAGWTCSKIIGKEIKVAKTNTQQTTPAPQVTPALISLSKWLVSTTAYLQDITTEATPDCAPTKQGTNTFWWFTLQDRVGAVQALPIRKTEYDAFLGMLPPVAQFQGAKAADTRNVPATQVIDRVLFETCAGTDRWAAQQCYVPPIPDNNCTSKGGWSGFFTGAVTAIFTWVVVGAWYKVYDRITKRRGYDRTAQNEDGASGSRVCGVSGFKLGMLAIVPPVAFGFAFGLSQFVDTVNMSGDCYDEMEFFIIPIAVALPVALAVIIAPWYLANYYPGMQEKALNQEKKSDGTKNTKLMLVDVGDGSANALDSLVARRDEMGQRYIGFEPESGSPFASYNAPMGSRA